MSRKLVCLSVRFYVRPADVNKTITAIEEFHITECPLAFRGKIETVPGKPGECEAAEAWLNDLP